MYRTILFQLAAMLIALTASAGADGAPDPARELYAKALSSMRRFVTTLFLDYRFEMLASHGDRTRREVYAVQERTSDHIGRMEGLRADGSHSGDVQVLPVLVPPDLFLRTAALDAASNGPGPVLPAIGSVVVSNYDVALAGSEDVSGCPQASKLELSPKGNPERYTLRTLWIDPATARICQAAVFRHVRIISPTTAIVTLNLAPDGYVTHWKFSGTGRLMFGPYAATVEGWYANIAPSPPLDPKLFR
jgi:hypothetical protein